MRHGALLVLPFLAIAAAAQAQTMPAPLAPPVSSPATPNPPSPLSPILSNPSVARSAQRAAPAPPATGATPLDQQQISAYRANLQSRQRALEQQGVGPAAEPYRDVQQQLNQLNGPPR